jgi:hypothetical protein
MNYKKILHTPFKSIGEWFASLIEGFQFYMQDAYDEMEAESIQMSISSATGTYLDKYAKDVNIYRFDGETDTSLRYRVQDAYRGICATKADLQILANRVLAYSGFTGTCTIYEWFNQYWLDLLDVGQFTVDLPNEVNYGFFLNYSFLNFQGPTRSYREPFFNAISSILDDMNWEAIRDIVQRKKASGTTFRLSWAGFLLDEE